MKNGWRAVIGVMCGGAVAAFSIGCRAGREDGQQVAAADEVAIAQGGGGAGTVGYAAVFEAARDVLRDEGFILERVDAAEGVITTRVKTTAGVFTPWDREQSTAGQEVEDLMQRQQRVVRVTFVGAAGEGEGAAAGGAEAGARFDRMRVEVVVQRVQIPGRKLEPEAIQQSSYWFDPDMGTRGMQPQFAVAEKQDRLLAERITRKVRERVGAGQ